MTFIGAFNSCVITCIVFSAAGKWTSMKKWRKQSNIFHVFVGKTRPDKWIYYCVFFLPGFSWTLHPTCKQCGLGEWPQKQSSHIYWRAVMKEQRIIFLYESHSHVPSNSLQWQQITVTFSGGSSLAWPLQSQRGHETRQEKMSELKGL